MEIHTVTTGTSCWWKFVHHSRSAKLLTRQEVSAEHVGTEEQNGSQVAAKIKEKYVQHLMDMGGGKRKP